MLQPTANYVFLPSRLKNSKDILQLIMMQFQLFPALPCQDCLKAFRIQLYVLHLQIYVLQKIQDLLLI